jgi:hypothetical protein
VLHARKGEKVYQFTIIAWSKEMPLFTDPVNVPCGVPTVQPITTRIVGGVIAKPGSWPWTV